jgi:hypothetical protein
MLLIIYLARSSNNTVSRKNSQCPCPLLLLHALQSNSNSFRSGCPLSLPYGPVVDFSHASVSDSWNCFLYCCGATQTRISKFFRLLFVFYNARMQLMKAAPIRHTSCVRDVRLSRRDEADDTRVLLCAWRQIVPPGRGRRQGVDRTWHFFFVACDESPAEYSTMKKKRKKRATTRQRACMRVDWKLLAFCCSLVTGGNCLFIRVTELFIAPARFDLTLNSEKTVD